MAEPPKTQVVWPRSLSLPPPCNTVPANHRARCRLPSAQCPPGAWKTQRPRLHRAHHLLWLLTCRVGRGWRQESRDLVSSNSSATASGVTLDNLTALDSSVSSIVKWGGWTLDDVKVPFGYNILWVCFLYYLFLFRSLFKSYSNWLLNQSVRQKSCRWYFAVILKWLPVSLSLTTSRDSVFRVRDKHKQMTL